MKKTLLALASLSLFGASSAMANFVPQPEDGAALETFQWAGSIPFKTVTDGTWFIVPADGRTTDFQSGVLTFKNEPGSDKISLKDSSELSFKIVKDSSDVGTPDNVYNSAHDKEPVKAFGYKLSSISIVEDGNFKVDQITGKEYFAITANGDKLTVDAPFTKVTEGATPTTVSLKVTEGANIDTAGFRAGSDIAVQAAIIVGVDFA